MREAHTPQEIDEVRALFEEYACSLDFDLDFQGFQKELDTLPGLYAPPHGRLILARVHGRPAGCVALRPLQGKYCEMKRLYVRPEFRGSGLGRVLAQRIITEAKEIGYTAMRLDTVAAMQAARALYARLGFREVPPYCFNPIEGATFLELHLQGENAHGEDLPPS